MDKGETGCVVILVLIAGLGWYGYQHRWFETFGWAPAPTTTEVSSDVQELSDRVSSLEGRVNDLESCIVSIRERQDFGGDSTVCPR
jgi:hypothetical protein